MARLRTTEVSIDRALVEEKPCAFSEIGNLLAERWPDRNPAALAQIIRAWVPLVQVPPRGVWGKSGPAAHTTVEAWLGRPLDLNPSLEELIRNCPPVRIWLCCDPLSEKGAFMSQ